MEEMWFKRILRRFGLEWFKVYYSCYRATVYDNNDPEKSGRLLLTVPQLYGKNVYEYWAYPKGMYCGNGTSDYLIPTKGDLVWVEFEGGNPRFPVWSYGHWLKDGQPSEVSSREKPDSRIIKTKNHTIELDDKEGSEEIRITDKFGNNILMNSHGISQVIGANGGMIFQGSANTAAEPALLGNKAKATLNNVFTDMAAITVPTAFGPSGVPINAPAMVQHASDMSTPATEILSTKVKLD